MKIFIPCRLIISLLSALTILGCSNLLLPDYTPKPITHYQYKKKRDGLEVIVQPFTDAQENEKYFGIDFKKMGYIPILLIARNSSTNNSFILKKEQVSIKIDNPDENGGVSLNKQLSDQKEELEEAATVAAYMLLPVISMFALNDKLNIKEIERNLLEKEFQTSTVSPGKKAHGFIYFKLPEKLLAAQTPLVVSIDAYNITTRQTNKLEVSIAQKGELNADSKK